MKKIFWLVTLLVNLTSAAGAAEKADCPISPTLAQDIARNTFMIIPINPMAPVISVPRAREYVEQNCQLNSLTYKDQLNCQILRACQGDDCQPVYGPHGTAFLGGDGRSLYTAWHVVFETHQAALTFLYPALAKMESTAQVRAYKNLVPEFILVNQNHEIVYDTRNTGPGGSPTRYARMGDPLSTLYIANGKKDDMPYGYFENSAVDYVEIILDRILGPGLKRAVATQDSRACLFTAGFAFNAQSLNFSTQSGFVRSLYDLKKSLGRFLDFQLRPLPRPRVEIEAMKTEDILSLMGNSSEQIRQQIKDYSGEKIRQSIGFVLDSQARHMRDYFTEKSGSVIFFDNPVLSGQSGGPLFNAQGEVMGIITNGFMETSREHPQAPIESRGGSAVLMESILPR